MQQNFEHQDSPLSQQQHYDNPNYEQPLRGGFRELHREGFQQDEIVQEQLQHVQQEPQQVQQQRPYFKRHQSSRAFKLTPPMHRRTSVGAVFPATDDADNMFSPGEDSSAKLPRFMTSRYPMSIILMIQLIR